METIRYSQIGKEDINFGTGTFEVRLADGRVVILTKLNMGNIPGETGTWTPSVGGTATYFEQQGYYTKVGNVVTVNCTLEIDTIGTGSTTTISGLPYTSTDEHTAVWAVYFTDLASNVVHLVARVPDNSQTIRLYSMAAAGDTLGLTGVIGSTTFLQFSGSYFTEE